MAFVSLIKLFNIIFVISLVKKKKNIENNYILNKKGEKNISLQKVFKMFIQKKNSKNF